MLIVKLSSIGDVVHTLPVSAAIKKSFPHIEITWIVEQMSAPMVMHNPYLSEVMVLPVEWRERVSVRAIKSFSKMRKDVKSRNFDMALDLQGLSKSAIVAWSSGAKYRFGYEWLRELAPHVITKIERRPQSIHIVDQFLDVAHFLGADVSNVEFPLVVTEEKMDAAVQKLSSLGICADEPYIVINPSPGGGGYKGLSADTFKDVVDALLFDPGYKIALVGSKSDAVVADEIVGHFPGKISSLCGQTVRP